MDPLQWMGAVRMRVQTADKNITIIHTTPVQQLTCCEEKRCVSRRFQLCPSRCFLLCIWVKKKNESIITLPLLKKSISCCLSRQNPATYLTVLACKQCLICADFSPDSDEINFPLEEAVLWVMDSYFIQKQWFEVKNILVMDLFLTNTAFLFTRH